MIAEETTTAPPSQIEPGKTALASYVMDLFEAFKVSRLPWEEAWTEAWNNYLAQYQPELNWRKETEGQGEGSRIFIKLTTLKCNTAHAKIVDLQPPDGSMPFDADVVNPEELAAAGIPDDVVQAAADRMRKKLRNHFREIKMQEITSSGTLEMAILGTGVLKGPIVEPVMRTRVVARKISGIPIQRLDPTANPYQIIKEPVLVPRVDHVPLWEYYTDFNAQSTKDAIGEIHFRRLLPQHFIQQAIKSGHDIAAVKEAARRATSTDPNDKKYIHLADNYTGEQGDKDVRVSSLEYWGLVPKQALIDAGVKEAAGPEYADDEAIEAKVCLAADGLVTYAKINTLGRRPFYVCPYKSLPHMIPGTGVAWAMRDSQKMINSSARLIIDNKSLSGVGMLGVNLDRINQTRTKNMKIYMKKVFYTKGNFSPKEAVDSISFPDVTAGLQDLMQMFVQFADEETGIPKYMSGEQGGFLNKMLDVNTPVPMADGSFKLLKDIKDGDLLIGSNGKSTKVIKAHEIHYPERAYEITFYSGEKIVAGGEHLWKVTFPQRTTGKNVEIDKTADTDYLYQRFAKKHGGKIKRKVYIPRARRIETGSKNVNLPIDPYILGLWLGDGFSRCSTICVNMKDDSFIGEYIEKWGKKEGYGITATKCKHAPSVSRYSVTGGFYKKLRETDLLKNKHIPEPYFKASYETRMELLRGLMDTDGTAYIRRVKIKAGENVRSCYEFTNKNERLIQDAERLIAGLGAFPTVLKRKQSAAGFSGENNHIFVILFNHIDNPFKLPRKAEKWMMPKMRLDRQRILSIKPAKKRLMRCLSVDAKDMLFAVGKRFTITRNTATGMSMLMGQANLNIKTVIKNIDDYWVEPIVEMFYEWFLDMDEDQTIKIPLRIRALGVESLVAKEIKMEHYMKFLQITQAPGDAVFVNRVKAMKNIAKFLDTEEIMQDDKTIAEIIAQAAKQAKQPKDVREMIDFDRLYPLLARSEQMQVLQMLNITPDTNASNVPPAPTVVQQEANQQKKEKEPAGAAA